MKELSFRPATMNDAALLFAWRSDPAVRASALDQSSISFDVHLAWLKSKLECSDCVIWILEGDGEPLGQIRYDRVGTCAEIDIAISSARRGEGLGPKLLQMSADRACRVLGIDRLVGIVKEENLASCRAFEKAGFQRVGADIHREDKCFRYERACESSLRQQSHAT
jgi:RimJ/RimL family protein N-acetyltransferase